MGIPGKDFQGVVAPGRGFGAQHLRATLGLRDGDPITFSLVAGPSEEEMQ